MNGMQINVPNTYSTFGASAGCIKKLLSLINTRGELHSVTPSKR